MPLNPSLQNEFKDVGLIVAAGGSSTRFGGPNKLLLPLGSDGLPVFCRLRALTPPLSAARKDLWWFRSETTPS